MSGCCTRYQAAASCRNQPPAALKRRVWLFDLDDTLHDAKDAAFAYIDKAMTAYIAQHLSVSTQQADDLRLRYWQRYGATLTGLVRHHGIDGDHFLHETHLLPGLEQRLRVDQRQLGVIPRLKGEKWVYTNGPRAYALRILKAAGISHWFTGVWGMEQSLWLAQYHPKPSQQALRRFVAHLNISPAQCVLVDDSPGNLAAASQIGLKTVWMCGYHAPAEQRVLRRRLKNVSAVIRGLDELQKQDFHWR